MANTPRGPARQCRPRRAAGPPAGRRLCRALHASRAPLAICFRGAVMKCVKGPEPLFCGCLQFLCRRARGRKRVGTDSAAAGGGGSRRKPRKAGESRQTDGEERRRRRQKPAAAGAGGCRRKQRPEESGRCRTCSRSGGACRSWRLPAHPPTPPLVPSSHPSFPPSLSLSRAPFLPHSPPPSASFKRRGREAEKGMVPDASWDSLSEWGGSQYPDEVTGGCCHPLVLDC